VRAEAPDDRLARALRRADRFDDVLEILAASKAGSDLRNALNPDPALYGVANCARLTLLCRDRSG
jgi:hypothetical protein